MRRPRNGVTSTAWCRHLGGIDHIDAGDGLPLRRQDQICEGRRRHNLNVHSHNYVGSKTNSRRRRHNLHVNPSHPKNYIYFRIVFIIVCANFGGNLTTEP